MAVWAAIWMRAPELSLYQALEALLSRSKCLKIATLCRLMTVRTRKLKQRSQQTNQRTNERLNKERLTGCGVSIDRSIDRSTDRPTEGKRKTNEERTNQWTWTDDRPTDRTTNACRPVRLSVTFFPLLRADCCLHKRSKNLKFVRMEYYPCLE